MDYISTNFDVDSSSHFPFEACRDRQTDRQTDRRNSHTELITIPMLRLLPVWVSTATITAATSMSISFLTGRVFNSYLRR